MSKRDPTHCDNCRRGVPHIGERCPRCHRPAPRLDGIPCKLCSPYCGTLTDPRTGITHAYKNGCVQEIDLATTKLKNFNVGDVPVTCLMCIGTIIEGDVDPRMLMNYAKDDVKATLAMVNGLQAIE